jgi:nucleotide-binding universal stress UspA family protein
MDENGSKIARILVALDSDAPNQAAIDAAVRLAEEFQAEIVGLFVTEASVLQVAAMPTIRHMIGQSFTAEPLEPGAMERAIRVLADRARAYLAAAAESHHIKWSFRSVSGSSEELVVTEAESFDVVALARGRHQRIVARASRTHCGVLMAKAETRSGRPVVLWADGPGAAIGLAIRLARQARVRLVVWMPASSSEEEVSEIARRIAADGGRGEVRKISAGTLGAAYSDLRLSHPGLLVVNRASPLAQDDNFERFVDSLDCAVFLTA